MDEAKSEAARASPFAPLACLGGLAVLTSALLACVGADNHLATGDEATALAIGRSIAADPLSAFTVTTGRGLERGLPLLGALVSSLTDSANQQVQILRATQCVAQALVAVPVFAVARQLDMSRWQALAPAAIGSTGAFAFFGVFALNTSVGVLAFMFFVWALLKAVDQPGVAGDGLLVASVALVALFRFGWAPMTLTLYPAIVAGLWFGRPDGVSAAEFLKRLPRQLVSRHALLVAVTALALVVLAALGLGSFTGGYGRVASEAIGWSAVRDYVPDLLAHLAIGVALVPSILAVPAILRNLFRPPSPAAGAFSWMFLAACIAFLIVYLRWAVIAGTAIEDRYAAVLVPLVALGAAEAVFARPVIRWPYIALAGVLITTVVATGYSAVQSGPFAFFSAPSSLFLERVVLGRLSTAIPLSTEVLAWFVLIGASGLAVAVAILAGRRAQETRAGAIFLLLVFVGLFAFQVAAMQYPAGKFIAAVGMRDLSEDDVEFIDREAGGLTVSILAPDGNVPAELWAQVPNLQAFNRSLGGQWPLGVGPGSSVFAGVDPDTGRINFPARKPEVLLTKSGFNKFGLAGRELRVPPAYSYVRLVRPDNPLRVNWLISGASPAGYSVPGQSLELRLFPHGSKKLCVSGNVLSDPRLAEPVRFTLSGPRFRFYGRLSGGQPAAFTAKAQVSPVSVLELKTSYSKLPDGSEAGAGLFDISLAPCR